MIHILKRHWNNINYGHCNCKHTMQLIVLNSTTDSLKTTESNSNKITTHTHRFSHSPNTTHGEPYAKVQSSILIQGQSDRFIHHDGPFMFDPLTRVVLVASSIQSSLYPKMGPSLCLTVGWQDHLYVKLWGDGSTSIFNCGVTGSPLCLT